MSSKAVVITEAEAAIVVEAARFFTDAQAGDSPRVTVRAWGDELEAWWQASQAPGADRR